MAEPGTTERRKHIIAAAEARSDLNTFAAVQALMERSLVTASCHSAEARIVAICKTEQQKCLRRYDAAVLKAGGGRYGE